MRTVRKLVNGKQANRKPADAKQAYRKEAEWKQVTKSASADDDAPLSAATLAALERIGVTPEQLAAAPKITPLLKQAQGGLKQIVDAMRFAPDDVIQAFLRRYDTLDRADHADLCWEAIALAAGVPVSALLGSIMVSLQQQSVSMVKMIALTGHPAITRARLKYGQMPSGERDRTAFDQALGLLPNPKGPTFIGKAIFGSSQDAMRQQKQLRRRNDDDMPDDDEDMPIAVRESDIDLDKLFPPANATQEKLVAIRQRILPLDTGKKTIH
jgi:hypothetical protein